VQVKRDAQAALDAHTRGLTRQERDAEVNRIAAALAARLGIRTVSRPIGRGPVVGEDKPAA
jgi:hypothetical protein